MPFFDFPLARLRDYRPEVRKPAGFDDFWQRTLQAELARDLDARITPVDTPLSAVEVYDVSWTGYGGQRCQGWLRVPARTTGPLPAVVQYRGYSGGRGYPHTDLLYALGGYAHLVMETRGQGWKTPSVTPRTPDSDPAAGDVHWPGMMTVGIGSPETYYYRRVYVDALRLVQAAATFDRVYAERIAVAGASQGGGLSIAVAGLAAMAGIPVAAALPNVPFLCHFERAVGLTTGYPYQEIADYLAANPGEEERCFETLSYVDGANFASYASIPAFFGVALMDQTCPPSTVFAAFNAWAGTDKQIDVYPWNDHEGGTDHYAWNCLRWLAEVPGMALQA